jgi:predicted  nucleic acid-binding Zn-ribbon protein
MSENCECNDFEEEVNDLKGELEQLREEFEELNERLQGKKEHKMPSTDEVETRWHKSEIISRYRDGIDDIYDEINKRYESFYELYLKEFERVYIIPLNECQDRVLKCSEKMTIEDKFT